MQGYRKSIWVAGVFAGLSLIESVGCTNSFAGDRDCFTCQAHAVRRYVRSSEVIDCRANNERAAEARLRERLARCQARTSCADSFAPDAVVQSVRDGVAMMEGAACQSKCTDPSCAPVETDPVDVSDVHGPVGRSPVAVDPTAAPSFQDVASFCSGHQYDAAPPVLALPAVTSLPDWCDEGATYAAIARACGAPRVVVVAAGADRSQAAGDVSHPFATIGDALRACHGPCHVLIGSGTYSEAVAVPDCTVLEGGVDVRDGHMVTGAARPRIEGSIRARGDSVLLSRLDVVDAYGALDTEGDVLVNDSILRGGYEAGSSAWGVVGPRICRSHLAGGYGGYDLAWHSSRLWIAGSAISACYEGAAMSWGSSDLRVENSVVFGGYNAIGTSWGSVGVTAEDSRLGSNYAAVNIHIAPDENDVFPKTFDVLIDGNSIASGTLPDSDPARNIVVRNNRRE